MCRSSSAAIDSRRTAPSSCPLARASFASWRVNVAFSTSVRTQSQRPRSSSSDFCIIRLLDDQA